MSQGAPIATTANTGLQALGTGGQLAIHAWDQIASYLRRTRGEAHAALFAEPNPDPDRGIVDWYDAEGGEATPIAQLPAPQAEAANAELARLVADIQADATRLSASKQPGDRFLGELLAQALRVPGPESRLAIGARPVLVAWGHARADGHAEPALIIGEVARRPGAGRMRIVGPPPAQPPRRAPTVALPPHESPAHPRAKPGQSPPGRPHQAQRCAAVRLRRPSQSRSCSACECAPAPAQVPALHAPHRPHRASRPHPRRCWRWWQSPAA